MCSIKIVSSARAWCALIGFSEDGSIRRSEFREKKPREHQGAKTFQETSPKTQGGQSLGTLGKTNPKSQVGKRNLSPGGPGLKGALGENMGPT